jgi:hypothetical protein
MEMPSNLDKLPLLPFLFPAGEGSEDVCKGMLVDQELSPVVALGRDHDKAVIFDKSGLDFNESLPLAIGNLRQRDNQPEWEPVDMEGGENGPQRFWTRAGDWLTASDVLDTEFLEASRKMVGSDVLCLAIPTREMMIMAETPAVLPYLSLKRYSESEESGEMRVVTHVFAYTEGKLYLALEVPVGDAPAGEEDEGHWPSRMTVENDAGEGGFVFALTENSMHKVGGKIQKVLQSNMNEMLMDSEFGGSIQFLINPEGNEIENGDEEKIRGYCKQITKQFASQNIATNGNSPVVVTAEIYTASSD